MTDPNTVPTKYAGDDSDYPRAPARKDGSLGMTYVSVTVAAATASGQIIGLVPVRKGARLVQGATQLYVADLDTGTDVTLDIGFIYDDNTTYTNDPNAFASALTTAQTGGLITFDEQAGLSYEAEADGWIAVTLGGGQPTTTEGAISGQIVLAYSG